MSLFRTFFSFYLFIFYCLFIFDFLFIALISAPESEYYLIRNPRNKNSGNFLSLSDFLAFAKGKDLQGVLLILEVRSLH
jgi:hypothetical protein